MKKKDFCLPEKIIVSDDTKEAFASLYGSYTAVNNQIDGKSKVLIYGLGYFYLKYEKQLNQEYYIEKFIDKNKNGYFAGKEIIKLKEINNYNFDKIIIMLQNEEESNKVAHDILQNYGVARDKVTLGVLKYCS